VTSASGGPPSFTIVWQYRPPASVALTVLGSTVTLTSISDGESAAWYQYGTNR
jgi:hypothetical protein